MCELLGISAQKKIRINDLLEIFFSHSLEHRNGWGLALPDEDELFLARESHKAIDSAYLKGILKDDINTSGCIAHIRKATIGEVSQKNTHPFSAFDKSGRQWILAHNGTIFSSGILAPYQYTQEGTTDSERILLYIIDRINKLCTKADHVISSEIRMHSVDDAIRSITYGNKVNLLIYDGEFLYAHKNEPGTMYEKDIDEGIMLSTVPLESKGWREFEQNRLMVYRRGELVYAGDRHDNTYIHDEAKMKYLYFAYSGL
ncbi:MAG: class II glutamine amidotransferase [Lachnospiraceae bacterium]|nr:class II glutamine amidotransferase [Lachnospiraceae bacterium]